MEEHFSNCSIKYRIIIFLVVWYQEKSRLRPCTGRKSTSLIFCCFELTCYIVIPTIMSSVSIHLKTALMLEQPLSRVILCTTVITMIGLPCHTYIPRYISIGLIKTGAIQTICRYNQSNIFMVWPIKTYLYQKEYDQYSVYR